jgi:uroporphyrinogen decarboxylase
MNSKERGLAPFLKQDMDRFPMWYGAAPEVTQNIIGELLAQDEEEALYKMIGLDYKTVRPKYAGKPLATFEDGTHLSEWGIRRGGAHWGQALTHPLAGVESMEAIEEYPFPDPDDFVVKFTKGEVEWTKGYCTIGGCWSPFFHDSTELVGMEEFFVKMYTDPDLMHAVIEKCFAFYYELDRRTFEANPGLIDMYFMGNDFGSQRALLMAPDMWREFYKPYVKKLIEQAKKYGCVTAVHSCGSIREIIGDFIEIGVDAINPIQVNAEDMNPQVLSEEFGEDCVFFGGIDENEILQFGTETEVRAETRRIIDILGRNKRYIVAASHDYILPEIPARNIIAMFDEAQKYGMGR